MKKILLVLLPLMLTACTPGENQETEKQEEKDDPGVITWNDYGAFLGRSDNNIKDFDRYKYVSFEFDDFEKNTIKNLSNKGVECFAYLNIGSLETYRSYYDSFSKYTFMDYDNWPEERWIDITNVEWQEFIVNDVAANFKEKGAAGVYLDNVDVYTIFKENDMNYSKAATALKSVIKSLNNLGLKILMNGGAEFIDDMNDQNDSILKSIWAYHQEEVFSLIEDYEKDEFGKQNKEDSKYYMDMASIMKKKGAQVFLLEYTTDETLKKEIDEFCSEHNYHYYCSSTVDLK